MIQDQVRHLNTATEPVPPLRGWTGAGLVYLGALLGLVLGFGGFLLAAWSQL